MATRAIIIGGGFGGLEAAFSLKSLLKQPSEILLIDRSPYHSFSPSIHLIISGTLMPEQIRIPLKVVLGSAGIRFLQEEVSSVDTERMEVTTRKLILPYDYLILSSGAESNFFSIRGAERFFYRFQTPEDAERIRANVLSLLRSGLRPCRIAVAGAGTEGIEVTGELLDLIRQEGCDDDVKNGRLTIELIEGKSRLVPSCPIEAQNRVEQYFRRRGVTLTAGDPVAAVEKDRVTLSSGQQRDAAMLIWSGGIQPSRLIRELPCAKDSSGWLKVTDRLHLDGDERVYGVGDAVSICTEHGPLALQRLACHAQDQARVAAFNIACHVEKKEQTAYVPKNKPQLISLGRRMGIFATEDRVYSGPWVVSLKKAVERTHLLTYLAKPVSATLLARAPGARMLQRLRIRLPL